MSEYSVSNYSALKKVDDAHKDNVERGVLAKTLFAGNRFPFMISPLPDATDKSVTFLQKWLEDNHDWIHEKYYEHGAVLFRGWDVEEATDFETIALTLDSDLKNKYLGTSPRNIVPNTNFIFTASEFPGHIPIPQHQEMSFLKEPPTKILFCALNPNTSEGGETPMTDFIKVWDDMHPGVKKAFAEKKIRNIRTYPKTSTWDPWKTKTWPQIFNTEDKTVVEETAALNGLECHWHSGEMLSLINTQEPTRVHPVTGDVSWSNHSQVFDINAIPDEYSRLYKRYTGWLRLKFWLLQYFSMLMVFLMRLFIPNDQLGQHVTYGDGSEIPREHMVHLRDLVWRNSAIYKHQKGDIAYVDNRQIAHGRHPYQGDRLVAVAWV